MSKYDQAFVDLLKKTDNEPPERYVHSLDELIQFLLDEGESPPPVPNGHQGGET